MLQPHRPTTGNRILDALPPRDFDHLKAHLELVPLELKQVLYRPGDKMPFVYFPASGVLSVVSLLQDGSAVEVGTVGEEGLAGLPALLGAAVSPHEVVVQGEGNGLRIDADTLQREFDRFVSSRDIILKFAELFLAEISQTAACNGRHSLEARCARWLLMMQDRLHADHFPMSQEFLAMLLGVRRTGVTAAALDLRRRKLIEYHYGRIDVLDRAGLEAAACECYAIIKDLQDRFLRE